MQSEAPRPDHPEAGTGLPPVSPPSARHILQLFLVPGIIVASFVFLYLGWNWLTQGWYTPEKFLSRLDNPDPDVRWQAAESLAQSLLRDDLLASDARFALDLAERLRQAVDADVSAEKSLAADAGRLSDPDLRDERRRLAAEQNYTKFLCACLGNFTIPAGAPVLHDMARKEEGDPVASARRRRAAVWALANLGENLKRFEGKLSPDRREAVLTELRQEAGPGERGRWATAALDYLTGRQEDRPQTGGVAAALAACAGDRDPFVREMTAVALNNWKGDPGENDLAEKALLRLLHDEGHGANDDPGLRELFQDDEGHGAIEDADRWKWVIRSQAVVALARRGSDRIDPDDLADWLDEAGQLQHFHRQLQDGRDVPDEAAAYAAITNLLKAIPEWHRQGPGRDLSRLNTALDRLTQSPNLAVRTEAKRTRIALGNP